MRARVPMTQKTSGLHGDPSLKAARLLEVTDDTDMQEMSTDPQSKTSLASDTQAFLV